MLYYTYTMEIRTANLSEKDEIVCLYKKVQAKAGIPNPRHVSPDDLEGRIYSERAIERYVVTYLGKIAGHGLIEFPDPGHLDIWRIGLGQNQGEQMIELGGAFTDPELKGCGLWTSLLEYRLDIIRDKAVTPVSATWMQNEHVKRTFRKFGGEEVGRQSLPAGDVSLFVFDNGK